MASGRAVADARAFALVPVNDGALFLYGAPHREGGGVRVLPLGMLGEARGPERPITRRGAAGGGVAEQHVSQAVEVAAASSGQRVGVAWIIDYGTHLETQNAFSPDGGVRFGPPSDLGPSVRVPADQGGRLAMAADETGALALYYRIPEAACVALEGRCARFSRVGVGGQARGAARGTEPLEVRRPCEPFVGAALWRAGTWYHGICTVDPAPKTTVYAIRPAVSYAVPVDMPDGCRPSSIAPLDDGVAVVSVCEGLTRIQQLDEMGRRGARWDSPERSVRCEDGRPALHLDGDRDGKLRLGEATDHLEGLLPDEIAPHGARAVWTGQALLVAVPVGHDVSLRRYQCVRGRFDRTDVR